MLSKAKFKNIGIITIAFIISLITTTNMTANSSHVHQAEYVPQTNATCQNNGNLEYWYCKECDKYYLDESLTKQTIKEQLIIPMTEHNWENDFTVDTDPKGKEYGIKSIHCSDCDARKDITEFKYLNNRAFSINDIPNTSDINYIIYLYTVFFISLCTLIILMYNKKF